MSSRVDIGQIEEWVALVCDPKSTRAEAYRGFEGILSAIQDAALDNDKAEVKRLTRAAKAATKAWLERQIN